jgi:hypothetical protein
VCPISSSLPIEMISALGCSPIFLAFNCSSLA